MDFPTRTLYRSAVEELSRGSNRTELDIAGAAAPRGPAGRGRRPGNGAGAVRRHGYTSCSPAGAPPSKKQSPFAAPCETGRRAQPIGRHRRLCDRNFPGRSNPARCAVAPPLRSRSWRLRCSACLALLGAIPAIDAAVALVNRGVNIGFSSDPSAGLELRDGVPAHLRTIVAVPTLLTTRTASKSRSNALKSITLRVRKAICISRLLTDWTDAANEHADGDDRLLDAAAEGIARLNVRYGPAPAEHAFFFFIAGGYGTKAKGDGSGGSASAASSTNSTGSCAARPTRPS